MATLYRVFAADGRPLGDANSIDDVVEIVKRSVAGRYRIDQITVDEDANRESTRMWGGAIKTRGGRVKLDPPPWAD
jgi:hypothetical protein